MAVLARAANVVTLPTVTGSPGDEVTLTIALDNTDAVSAMQLQIPVTPDVTVVTGSETLGARAATHSATVGVRDGLLNVMVWNTAMTTFTGNSGEVLSFRLLLGNEPGTVSLVANKVTLTDADGNTLPATATNGSVTISAPKAQLATRDIDFGHIPIRDVYHQSLQVTNVGNAPLIISGIEPSAPEFSSTTVFPYIIEPGYTGEVDITYSPVERGAIEETVRLLSNNIAGTNTIRVVADPFAVNELHVENATGIADSTVTIPLRVNNMDAITGFQFEFDLPEQLKYVDGSFALTGRSGGHQLTVTCKGQHLTAIAWSLTDGAAFTGNDGIIATFDVLLDGRNSTYLDASKAVLTANYKGEDMDVLSAKYKGYITIKSPQLNAPTILNMGATPITQVAQGTVLVRNRGSAPLRIDRVVFDTDSFTVTEAMPIVIENGRNVTLHVGYNGQEQAPFEAMMQLYSNDPDHRLHNITVTGSRFAPNYLHFTAEDLYRGDDLLLHIDMSNYDPINGLQFDLDYPAQWLEPAELIPTNRATSFSMMWRSIGNGKARFFIYSLSDGVITPGEGEIAVIRFTASDEIPVDTYQLDITEISMGTPELTDKFAGTDQQTSFTVIDGLRGDANEDGKVDVNDVTTTINYILGKNPSPFNYRNANVNDDNTVNVMDVTTLINIILGNQ